MSDRRIIDSFNEWRQTGEPLVMATVYATEGSSYSKAGHRMIISVDGHYQGFVNGGGVEGDLTAHAHLVFTTGDARTIIYHLPYDLRENGEMAQSMGSEGTIKILLQRLDAATGYEPFRTIAERQTTPNGGGTCVTVIESEDSELPPGATWIDWGADNLTWQMPDDRMSAIRNQSNTLGTTPTPKLLRQPSRGGAFTALHAPIIPIPRLLILGGGPDAIPLATLANEIGWLVTIVDHRQICIDDPAFATAEHSLYIPLQEFPSGIKLDHYAAAVVMTHNLEADGQYLSCLATNTRLRYIGLLGPKARCRKIFKTHDLSDSTMTIRLHDPADMLVGVSSPEAVALFVLTEIQQTLDKIPDNQ